MSQDVIYEIQRSVGRIEGQLGALIEAVKTRDAEVDDDLATLEKRQRRVEDKLHWYSGVSSAAGLIFGAVATAVSEKVFHA